ncbi:MAG: class I SAM-dependent methyltransferase, partial [Thermoguttaceae bacterium]
MPRCGDGKLSVEMAKNSKLLVYALTDNPAGLATARKAADEAGLLGRTVYVEEGGVSKNPLADWSADLLVIDDASDADLDQIAQKEVRRVLSPYRGVAIVGRAKTLGAGLTRARLEAWLTGLAVSGGKIVEDDFGLWTVVTMPPLAGGDDWSHYAHGPDQNRFSRDESLKWPYLIQWTAKPYYDGKFDIAVAAGGRLFRANVTLAVDNT